jgi:hypothetical protein
MVKVTGPTGPQGPQPTAPAETHPADPSKPSSAVTQQSGKAMEDGFQRGPAGLMGYKSSPLVSGAMKIFSDGVMFPPNLLDPNDPKNDPKYLRLLAAVLGLEELERHFYTLEGEEQEAYWEHKAEQRERKLAKIEEEKQEKKRQREEGGGDEEE